GVVINNTTHLGYMSYDTTPGERAVMTFNPVPNAGSIDSSISVSNTLSWVGGNGPRALAVDESRDHLYMAMEGMGHIEMTSGSSTENVIRVLTGPTNDDYVSLSVNATSNRLFAAKADSIDVFSLETGALLGTVTGFTFNGNTKGISAVEGWNRVFFATTNVPQLVDLESLAEPVCTPEAPVDVVAGSSVTFTPSCTDADDSTVEEFEITNAQSRGDADPTVDRAAIKYSANSVGQDDIAYRVTTQNGWSIEKHQLVNVSAAPVTPPTEPEVPVVRKTTNLVLESGDVYIKLPGSNEFVKLTKDMLIPIGTVIDAREGRAHLTLANADGTLYDGVFWDGIFQVTQGSGNKPITTLKLRDDLVARAAGFATARTSAELERSFYAYTAKKRGKKKNGLWGDGKGKFKTSGKGGSATVRGTRWYVANYANGSLFKVSRGSVTIDPIRGRNFVLKAGKSFFIFYKR
ncbi:MAG: hypothetical protein ACRDKE_07765, partial [Solirubrobacterales bacterium]